MINFKLKHEDFLNKQIISKVYEKSLNEIYSNLNEYITLEQINNYAENYSKKINNNQLPSNKKSSSDSIKGRIYEEITALGIDKMLENHGLKNDICITKDKALIDEFFSIRAANDAKLRKTCDIDLLLHNTNKSKFYALSIKGTTRERIAQSQLYLFLFCKDVMNLKYKSCEDFFKCKLWSNNIKFKYGIVVFDNAKTKDYIRYSKTGSERKSTRKFDAELFYQDKEISGGFTILNNNENFENTIKFNELIGRIIDFFQTK